MMDHELKPWLRPNAAKTRLDRVTFRITDVFGEKEEVNLKIQSVIKIVIP